MTEEAAADARVKSLMEEVKSLREQSNRYRELEIQIEALKMQMGRTVKLYELTVKDSSTAADHQSTVQP